VEVIWRSEERICIRTGGAVDSPKYMAALVAFKVCIVALSAAM